MRDPKNIIINGKQLSEILEAHRVWLITNKPGARANLANAALTNADLTNANLRDADLRYAALTNADLRGANLRGAALTNANLRYANLMNADLRYADLTNANLRDADLRYAALTNADLRGANLRGAALTNANLRYANLMNADLRYADLTNADLRGAALTNADLRDAKNANLIIAMTKIVPEGEIIGWKKCKDNIIVKLLIPSDARRSNATGRKCRAEYAIDAGHYEIGSNEMLPEGHIATSEPARGPRTVYAFGNEIRPDKWDDDRWNECSNGIHFFITREEAEAY